MAVSDQERADREQALQDTLRYRKGHEVVVYFNPEEPAEAVIRPELILAGTMTYGEAISLYGSLILCGGGILLLLAGILGFRK
jgi:hypothetical protein